MVRRLIRNWLLWTAVGFIGAHALFALLSR